MHDLCRVVVCGHPNEHVLLVMSDFYSLHCYIGYFQTCSCCYVVFFYIHTYIYIYIYIYIYNLCLVSL